MANPLDEERVARRAREARRRQMLADLRAVLERREGRVTLARILRNMGLGRPIEREEVMTLGHALGLMGNITEANPEAARQVLALVFGLENGEERQGHGEDYGKSSR